MKKILQTLLLVIMGGSIGMMNVKAETKVAEILDADGKTVECSECTDDLATYFEKVEEKGTIKILSDIKETTTGLTITKDTSFTLDLNGKTISGNMASSSTLRLTGSAKITMKNGTLKYDGTNDEMAPLKVLKGEVTLEGVKVINENNDSTVGTIQVGNLDDENVGKLIIKSGTEITGHYGVVYVNGSEITMTGGKINSTAFAISGNGADTKANKVTISGGTITSNSTAIYQPSNTTLTISSGNITGKSGLGIVARQGTVKVTGGKISATGTGKSTIGDSDTKLPYGVAIVVDNETEGYGNDSKVTIEDGAFESTNEKAIVSYTSSGEEQKEDFVVTGGSFNHAFNKIFMEDDLLEVQVSDVYYVGKTAEAKVKEVAEKGNTKLTVIQGDLEIEEAANGLEVVNEGEGTVTVEDQEIAKGKSYTVEKKQEELDDVPKTGQKLPTIMIGLVTFLVALAVVLKKKIA